MALFRFFDKETDIKDQIQNWINSTEMQQLVETFGGEMPSDVSVSAQLDWLVEFSNVWDFRAERRTRDKETGEKARWLLDETSVSSDLAAVVMNSVMAMGLVGIAQPVEKNFDYALVLGGARMACLYRVKYARTLREEFNVKYKWLAALCGMRPIAESERQATDTYAPGAQSEFDLLRAAMQMVYPNARLSEKSGNMEGNVNASWALENYLDQVPMQVLAAPSSEPDQRRANTADTFDFWIKQQHPAKGSKVLLITSQIYVPYQQVIAIRLLGLKMGMYIETVGFPTEWSYGIKGLQRPVNYLQEIRATVMELQKLWDASLANETEEQEE